MKTILLVLESVWTTANFSDNRSVRPFIEGWAAQHGVGVSFRSYYDKDDLKHWLKQFYLNNTGLDTCYLAGHGIGSRLTGLKHDLNIRPIVANIFKKTGKPRNVNSKGLLIGACECGGNVHEDMISQTNSKLAWVAGYRTEIPWLEATLCDILFLEYLFFGRVRRQKAQDGRLVQISGVNKSRDIKKIANWVRQDFSLAAAWDFGVATR